MRLQVENESWHSKINLANFSLSQFGKKKTQKQASTWSRFVLSGTVLAPGVEMIFTNQNK